MKIKNLDLTTPKIVVPFTDKDAHLIPKVIEKTNGIVEFRIDQFSNPTDDLYIKDILEKYEKYPIIGTFRSKEEDVKSKYLKNYEIQRLNLIKKILPFVDCIDIEFSSKNINFNIIQMLKEKEKLSILSYHNFVLTPEFKKLQKILEISNANLKPDILKIATKINNNIQYACLEKFLNTYKDTNKLSVVGMGNEYGPKSRIEFLKLGNVLTYASNGITPNSLGQISYKELLKTFSIINF